jgi:hypothetical protein
MPVLASKTQRVGAYMKKFITAFTAALMVAGSLIGLSTPAQASSLNVMGGTVTWDPATLYEPTGCSSFNFNYNNGTGLRLLQLEFQVKSKFGDSVIRESQIGIPAGTSGQWRVQVCRSDLIDGLGPYRTELTIEDYNGTSRMVTGSLAFRARSTGTAPSGSFRPVFPEASVGMEVLGGRVSWDPNSLFQPTGCSNFNFNYVNGTGIRLLQLEFQVKSKFGDSMIRESEIGIPAGNSGVWRVQVCRSALTDGLGPYSVEVSIEDYNGTVRSVQGTLSFVSRTVKTPPVAVAGGGSGSAAPAPAPVKAAVPLATSATMRKVTSPGSAPADLVALSPSVQKSVVTVLCSRGQGSGWSALMNPSTTFSAAGYKSYIVTNHHVIEDCLPSGSVTVRDQAGSQFAGTVIAFDAANDLAGIAISAEIPPLHWQGETPAQGWWVGVMGTPKGQTGVLTTGIISRVNESTNILNLTAPLNPGNSGGPAFDKHGRVVGVVSAKYVDTEGFGIAQGTPLMCVAIMSCSNGSPMVWSKTGLVSPDPEPTAAPKPSDPNAGSVARSPKVDKRTLAAFSGTSFRLNFTQQQQIAAAVLGNPNANKFTCSGLRLKTGTSAASTLASKRAKAACDYAKKLNPRMTTAVNTAVTTARTSAGRVLVTVVTNG